MEDLMNTTEAGSLYVLICSLIGTVISILAVGTSPLPHMLLLAWLPKHQRNW